MRGKFIPAKEVIKITEEAEKNCKETAKAKALQILEEFDFNQKVQEAARNKKWVVREPIFVEDYDVATALCEIVNDLGYTAHPMPHGYGKSCYRILIGWSQVQTRVAAGERR